MTRVICVKKGTTSVDRDVGVSPFGLCFESGKNHRSPLTERASASFIYSPWVSELPLDFLESSEGIQESESLGVPPEMRFPGGPSSLVKKLLSLISLSD